MSPDTEPKAPAAPPYISFKTLTNLLERLHETDLPPRIDRSYLDGEVVPFAVEVCGGGGV